MKRDVALEQADIEKAIAGQTLCSSFQNTVKKFPQQTALQWKKGDTWQQVTWSEYAVDVHAIASGLMHYGLQPQEFVNILCTTRYQYYATELALLHCGATCVPLYTTLAPEQIQYVVGHCEAKFVIVENQDFYQKLVSIKEQIPHVKKVIVLEEAPKDDPWVLSYNEVLAAGRAHKKEIWQQVKPDNLATLIYTSGTTGVPKGVMISHYNILWTMESSRRIMQLEPELRQISYLPLAHVAEKLLGFYMHLQYGTMCYLCPNPQEIASYLKDVHPQLFLGVPRVWEKLYAALNAAINNWPDVNQKNAIEQALKLGISKVQLQQQKQPIPEELEQQIQKMAPVLHAVRQRIGLDEIEFAVVGAAPMAPKILEWFYALGIPIMNIYGQTECTAPACQNRPEFIKIGTVGVTLPGVEMRTLSDGEILLRGGNVASGYYKEPELTKKTFADGWLHTGDIVKVEDGFISIVDRKKEIIVTSSGKNIAPSAMENYLKERPLIGQICVIGDNHSFLTALITLNTETAGLWAKEQNLPGNISELSQHPQAIAELQGYFDEANQHFSNIEQIKKFTILPKEWSIESGELTPTMKLKRKVISQKYADAIAQMYG